MFENYTHSVLDRFTSVSVKETDSSIEIDGIRAPFFTHAIDTMWRTSKIAANMFSKATSRKLVFPSFFAVEVLYVFERILAERKHRIPRKQLIEVITKLKSQTWLKSITEPTTGLSLDRSALKRFNTAPLDHQYEFFQEYEQAVTKYRLRGYLLAAAPGSGKAQPLTAPIKVPGGWSTMGEMHVGKVVVTPKGHITRVNGVFPQGVKDIYRVEFSDGRSTECCIEHLWKVRLPLDGVEDYAICSLKDIVESESFKQGKASIPLIASELSTRKNYDVEPYSLGVIIGDRNTSVHVSEEYLEGSTHQRMQLLQGLLDTAGIVLRDGSVLVRITSNRVAISVQKLVRSLGYICELCEIGGIHSLLYICGNHMGELFTNSVKQEKVKECTKHHSEVVLGIKSITYIGKKEAQCISVEDSEHLYVTGDYIVTHNTLMYYYLSEMLNPEVTIILCPKNAVDRVFRATTNTRFGDIPKTWYSDTGEEPTVGMRYYVCHYEALEKLSNFLRTNGYNRKKVNVCLDECHNFNDLKSMRTELFVDLCNWLKPISVLWGSGTPIKAMGSEVIPLLRTIDDYFTTHVEVRFRNIFGLSSARGLDILANRIGKLSYKIDKQVTVGNQVDKYRVDVSISNGKRYTLSSIRALMSQYVEERQAYYKTNEKKYLDQYFAGLQVFEATLKSPASLKEFAQYKAATADIRKNYDPVFHKEISAWCNRYEKRNIIPVLNQPLKNEFKAARSVYKYVDLKIVGEALGRILGKERMQCNVDMLNAIENYRITELFDSGDKYDSSLLEIIGTSDSKTLIFTSYIEVVTALEEKLKKQKLQPMMVYGETNRNLPAIMQSFDTNPKIDPLIATYMSLSTAVPVTSASTVVFLNAPYRSNEYEQALSRVDRLGQQHTVRAYDVYLDTGGEPNISTRSVDIMEWSKSQVEAIMGVKGVDTAALEDIGEDTTGEYYDPEEDNLQMSETPAVEAISVKAVSSWSNW